jgi:hypothetical protein
LANIQSPFAADGLHSSIAARDQQIALLQFELRRAQSEAAALRDNVLALTNAQQQGGSNTPLLTDGSSGGSVGAALPSNSMVAGWLGSDEDGQPINDRERRTLNALVRRYLLARGYRSAAIALAEEVQDQDLTDDTDLLALPGHARRAAAAGGIGHSDSSGHILGGAAATPGGLHGRIVASESLGGGAAGANTGRGVPVLTLLDMHRKRIAPIQALAESEARSDVEISSLKQELQAYQQQLDAQSNELEESKRKIAQLENELVQARTVRGTAATPSGGSTAAVGASDGSSGAAEGQTPTTAATPVPTSSLLTPPPPPAVPSATGSSSGGAATLSLAHAPALLKVLHEAVPSLKKHLVTRQKGLLAPLLSSAIAADASVDGRRSLLQTLLSMMRRPTQAERQLIKTQIGVLASRLGPSAVESELLPEITLLARNGKTRERKALAATLCGALAPHVSDKRCDGLLATLATLAESSHAVVRVGVIDGLTQVATTLAERWSRTLASGVVVGSNTSMEASSARQLSSVEFILWKTLLGSAHAASTSASSGPSSSTASGGAAGAGGAGDEDEEAREAADLQAAQDEEFPLAIPASLA